MKEGDYLRKTGYVNDIQLFSLSDGAGIRSTVFLKGCLLNCRWCHNPEGKRRYPEVFPYRNNCTGCGDCVEVCPTGAIMLLEPDKPYVDKGLCNMCLQCVEACGEQAMLVWGKLYSVGEVMEEVEADKPFYRHSGGGMTLSGGEPMAQPGFSRALMLAAKDRGIHTTLDTCGHVSWEVLRGILEATDCVLLDIKHMDPLEHRRYCGADNRLILENARRLAASGVELRFRIPLIPGFNDSEENLQAVAGFIGELAVEGEHEVDILPYHPYAGVKYRIFGLDYPFPEGEGYPEEKLLEIIDIFKGSDLVVTLGG